MAVYVDDTLASGGSDFEKLIETKAKTFDPKQNEYPIYICFNHYQREQERIFPRINKTCKRD